MSSLSKESLDSESLSSLSQLATQDQIRAYRVPGVRTVLVVLSAAGIVYDIESMRQKILLAYPQAVVFFVNTVGKAVGAAAPHQVDLLIDFTGPGQRQGILMAKKFRRMARIAVGRNAGLFRKRIYDRVFDEKAQSSSLPADVLRRERVVQKQVLALGGVPMVSVGEALPDRSKSIALELPPMAGM